ncbi:MAG: hypothetical protein QM736_17540 [Vicinamibacterales bacterium]
MTARRELADFTVAARRLYDAARGHTSSVNASPLSPQRESARFPTGAAALTYRLLDGQPFRLAARAAGLNRADAKHALEQTALRLVDVHRSLLTSHKSFDVTHAMAWAFTLKERGVQPARLNRLGPRAIRTHVWIDRPSRLVVAWLPGPSDFAALADTADAPLIVSASARAMACVDLNTASEMADPLTPLSQWLSTLESGSWKKVRANWIATSLFVAADNFCARQSTGPTPAMRAGWTSHAWQPEDLANASLPQAHGISA